MVEALEIFHVDSVCVLSMSGTVLSQSSSIPFIILLSTILVDH